MHDRNGMLNFKIELTSNAKRLTSNRGLWFAVYLENFGAKGLPYLISIFKDLLVCNEPFTALLPRVLTLHKASPWRNHCGGFGKTVYLYTVQSQINHVN